MGWTLQTIFTDIKTRYKMKRKSCQANLSASNPDRNYFKTWKISEVKQWLCDIGLHEYCTFFSRIDGKRLTGVTSSFLDSIGMLDVDRTVFYLELQKLYGKRVKLALVKPKLPAKKVVTITESTHVVHRQDGTLVIKTGPEIQKVQIIQSKAPPNREQPDKDYLIQKYLDESQSNQKSSPKKKSLWNGVKEAAAQAYHTTKRDFLAAEMPPDKSNTEKPNTFRIENIAPACDFPITHGLW